MNLSEEWHIALKVIHKIEEAGFEAVIVGGAVRDSLLNKKVNDVDIATSALPLEVKEIFPATVDVGIEHGTVLVLMDHQPFEVTTYRTEGPYTDYRRPEEVVFVRSLEEDLKRRDFTINAMAISKDGNLIDLFGGIQDIQNKIIRAVGDPNVRFREDALRMLRAIRFSAQLGFSIEEQTLKAIQIDSDLIQFIAKERVAAEMAKMWKSKFVYEGLQALIKSNLSKYLVGNFKEQLRNWKHFQTNIEEVGWAYLSLLNRYELSTIFDFYRLSKKEKVFIRKVLNCYDALDGNWTVMDYFSYDLPILETAYDFAKWQQKSLSITKDSIIETKSNLPIQSYDQLKINGNDLMEWSNRRKGPWIKVALDAAIIVVLNKLVENDKEMLKEWFLNDFID